MKLDWLGAIGGTTVLIGDSLAVGLEKPLKVEFGTEPFQAFAKGGTSVAQWNAGSNGTQLTAALALPPKRMLVSLGTNDTNSKVPADKLKTQVAELVSRIKEHGAEVIWLMPGILPWVSTNLDDAVRATGVRMIQQPPVPKSDGIHPTGEGYKTWAKSIHDQLTTPQVTQTGGSRMGILSGLLIVGAAAAILYATLNVHAPRR